MLIVWKSRKNPGHLFLGPARRPLYLAMSVTGGGRGVTGGVVLVG